MTEKPHPAGRRLVVFSNDPLYKYHEKGEVKRGYWNPGGLFDEVHVISLSDREIAAEEVAELAGNGRLFVHPVGRPSATDVLRLGNLRRVTTELIARIEPNLIRAHNPSIHGWLAVRASDSLKVPSVISLHCDYARWRTFRILGPTYAPRFARSLVELALFEREVFRSADLILSAYEFPLRYASRFRPRRTEVVYNKVYGEVYGDGAPPRSDGPLRVLSVGRQFPGKDPAPLIESLQHFSNVELTLIGQGPYSERCRSLASRLELDGRVHFLQSVENREIHEHYLRAHAFAIAIRYPGICIPVLEAMAAGLPVVVPQPWWEPVPELIGADALVVDGTPQGFAAAFRRLCDEPDLGPRLGSKGRQRHRVIDGRIMEVRESELLSKLMDEHSYLSPPRNGPKT
jgi:glycosyltransferase involved in cell wall biosynthesis